VLNIARREKLREYIQDKGEVTFKELEDIFSDVSSMTVRRDLAYLESKGYIIRTRGGARSAGSVTGLKEDVYSLRAMKNIEGKMKIAKKALNFVETGRSIYIDSGTTTMCLAKLLPDENFSILTSGPNISMEVIKNKNTSVNLVGGQLSRDNLSTSGISSLNFIKNINIDIAFMATSGFSLKSGFTSGDFNECELKKAIIKKARKVIMLMDTTKIDKNMPFTFAWLRDIDILICDANVPEDLIKAAQKNNVEIY